MTMFDIDFDHEMFLVYVQELHQHLFENATLTDLFDGIHDHHQKHHMVTLHLLRDKETFYHYYERQEELGISSIFDIIIGALIENPQGDKIKEHLVSYLNLSSMKVSMEPDEYDKKVFMKNLKSFMAYARKRKGVFQNYIESKENTD